MDVDNIIYILLIIIVFVFSLFGHFGIGRKKIPERVVTNDEVKYSLNDFEKILERKQEFQQTAEQNNDLEEKTPEPDVEVVTKNSNPVKSTKQIDRKEENEISDGFDIKSAIIYSSILERKKFRH